MKNKKAEARLRRKRSIRKKIYGTEEKPRLSVFRSAKNIYAQAIDDVTGKTIVALSTLNAEVKKEVGYGGNIKAAEITGKMLSEKLKEKGIREIVFDRNGYLFHGRVKALADQIKL
ncbi:MAG TPA: 50S ribosomal protein L18 [Atribacterota bacterium]|nr:50S ribosomal protein L18 [Atribacterota bacterium]HOR41669.1 50S ribosomal protein L18 [Atribacterota bacterium]